MIYKIYYTFQYEANQFLYGLDKGDQQYIYLNDIKLIQLIKIKK